jgi:hypothetical protein
MSLSELDEYSGNRAKEIRSRPKKSWMEPPTGKRAR